MAAHMNEIARAIVLVLIAGFALVGGQAYADSRLHCRPEVVWPDGFPGVRVLSGRLVCSDGTRTVMR